MIKDSENNLYRYAYDLLGRNTAVITSYGQVEYTLDGETLSQIQTTQMR